MLLVLLVALPAYGADTRRFEFDIPSWFATSFLDFPEEVREAAKAGKRVMVYFGQDGCPYCAALMNTNFSQRDIVEATRSRFVAIALNLWGDRETVWLDGKARSEKELGALLKVQFTPTLLFLDEKGAVALRLNGYQPPARFRLALDYAGKRLEREMPFAQFVATQPAAASRAPLPDRADFGEAKLDRKGKGPMLVLFESRDCDACAELHAALRREDVRGQLRAFETARIDAFGKGPVVTSDGAQTTEAQLARAMGVSFTPTLVFLDASRREVFRIDGYIRPFHLVSALDYVASGAWKSEPSFQRFLQSRADRERAAGRAVDLW